MNDFFLILQYLTENKIKYCHQYQPQWDFHNLSLDDPKGNYMMLRNNEPKLIEQELKIIWGHVLPKNSSPVIAIEMTEPAEFAIAPPMPLPPGM